MSEAQPSSSDAAPSVAGPSTSAPSPGPGTTFAGPKTKLNPITMPSMEQIMQEDAMNNCVVKTILSGVMGGIAGVAFGLFTASIENSGGGIDGPLNDAGKTTRVVLREMLTNMREKSVSYAKGFAVFGAIYSFNECIIENFRAKHDKWNPAMAGCATGAMLAHSAGPKAMCIGCASVGAFSLAIEHFLDR